MTDIRHVSQAQDRSASETADHEQVRQAARAGYQGTPGGAPLSDAVKQRDYKRAERERTAAKFHYLGASRKPL
jgi:hypothetical protein